MKLMKIYALLLAAFLCFVGAMAQPYCRLSSLHGSSPDGPSRTATAVQLKLPSIFSSGMVLQRDAKINVWGWSQPGADVKIRFLNKQYTCKVDVEGLWRTRLAPAKAGTGGDMTITAEQEQIVLKDILIGEVWVCSGQSNMEFPMNAFKDFYAKEIAASKNDAIRYTTLKKSYDNNERTDAEISNKWTAVNPETVGDCSAVAYFFAKKLHERLKVPVGLIVTSWGGTPAQAWMDTKAIVPFENYQRQYDNAIRPLDFSKMRELQIQAEQTFRKRIGEEAAKFKAYLPLGYDDSGWENTTLPGAWEGAGHPDFDGIAAYRMEFVVPEVVAGKAATLYLPAIDDIDSTYINGVFLGSRTVWNEKRIYNIPAGVLKAGKNMLSIWVEDDQGGGGLANDADHFYVDAGTAKIPLKGAARFKMLAPLESATAGVNLSSIQNAPSVLFNAMIAPLLNLSFRGVIWYQGESNAYAHEEYRTLFPGLIQNWRQRFHLGDFPFLFVQLSSYNPAGPEPAVSDWAFLREAQTLTLKLPNTGMAVSTDVGDQYDIHPKRKKEVGERLAAHAFRISYGFSKEISEGPSFQSTIIRNNSIVVGYKNVGRGLKQNGTVLNGFAVAGADKKFYPAAASISGNMVVVNSTQVAKPVYVRYAWASAPLQANLYNKEGFPAVPFRTDN
jgi:sialate O-acetylesterase